MDATGPIIQLLYSLSATSTSRPPSTPPPSKTYTISRLSTAPSFILGAKTTCSK
jgi:hypothetical protein